MISTLRGKLLEVHATAIVIEVGGVGYAIAIPLSSVGKLPPKGDEINLLIHHHFGSRFDPTQKLFGFLTAAERDLYQLLLDIGIGPKVALNIIGGIAPDLFHSTVAAGDAKALASVPGVGKKLAERIVLELREKISLAIAAPAAGDTGQLPADQQLIADAVAALIALGYKPLEAHQSIRAVAAKLGKKANLETLVRSALK